MSSRDLGKEQQQNGENLVEPLQDPQGLPGPRGAAEVDGAAAALAEVVPTAAPVEALHDNAPLNRDDHKKDTVADDDQPQPKSPVPAADQPALHILAAADLHAHAGPPEQEREPAPAGAGADIKQRKREEKVEVQDNPFAKNLEDFLKGIEAQLKSLDQYLPAAALAALDGEVPIQSLSIRELHQQLQQEIAEWLSKINQSAPHQSSLGAEFYGNLLELITQYGKKAPTGFNNLLSIPVCTALRALAVIAEAAKFTTMSGIGNPFDFAFAKKIGKILEREVGGLQRDAKRAEKTAREAKEGEPQPAPVAALPSPLLYIFEQQAQAVKAATTQFMDSLFSGSLLKLWRKVGIADTEANREAFIALLQEGPIVWLQFLRGCRAYLSISHPEGEENTVPGIKFYRVLNADAPEQGAREAKAAAPVEAENPVPFMTSVWQALCANLPPEQREKLIPAPSVPEVGHLAVAADAKSPDIFSPTYFLAVSIAARQGVERAQYANPGQKGSSRLFDNLKWTDLDFDYPKRLCDVDSFFAKVLDFARQTCCDEQQQIKPELRTALEQFSYEKDDGIKTAWEHYQELGNDAAKARLVNAVAYSVLVSLADPESHAHWQTPFILLGLAPKRFLELEKSFTSLTDIDQFIEGHRPAANGGDEQRQDVERKAAPAVVAIPQDSVDIELLLTIDLQVRQLAKKVRDGMPLNQLPKYLEDKENTEVRRMPGDGTETTFYILIQALMGEARAYPLITDLEAEIDLWIHHNASLIIDPEDRQLFLALVENLKVLKITAGVWIDTFDITSKFEKFAAQRVPAVVPAPVADGKDRREAEGEAAGPIAEEDEKRGGVHEARQQAAAEHQAAVEEDKNRPRAVAAAIDIDQKQQQQPVPPPPKVEIDLGEVLRVQEKLEAKVASTKVRSELFGIMIGDDREEYAHHALQVVKTKFDAQYQRAFPLIESDLKEKVGPLLARIGIDIASSGAPQQRKNLKDLISLFKQEGQIVKLLRNCRNYFSVEPRRRPTLTTIAGILAYTGYGDNHIQPGEEAAIEQAWVLLRQYLPAAQKNSFNAWRFPSQLERHLEYPFQSEIKEIEAAANLRLDEIPERDGSLWQRIFTPDPFGLAIFGGGGNIGLVDNFYQIISADVKGEGDEAEAQKRHPAIWKKLDELTKEHQRGQVTFGAQQRWNKPAGEAFDPRKTFNSIVEFIRTLPLAYRREVGDIYIFEYILNARLAVLSVTEPMDLEIGGALGREYKHGLIADSTRASGVKIQFDPKNNKLVTEEFGNYEVATPQPPSQFPRYNMMRKVKATGTKTPTGWKFALHGTVEHGLTVRMRSQGGLNHWFRQSGWHTRDASKAEQQRVKLLVPEQANRLLNPRRGHQNPLAVGENKEKDIAAVNYLLAARSRHKNLPSLLRGFNSHYNVRPADAPPLRWWQRFSPARPLSSDDVSHLYISGNWTDKEIVLDLLAKPGPDGRNASAQRALQNYILSSYHSVGGFHFMELLSRDDNAGNGVRKSRIEIIAERVFADYAPQANGQGVAGAAAAPVKPSLAAWVESARAKLALLDGDRNTDSKAFVSICSLLCFNFDLLAKKGQLTQEAIVTFVREVFPHITTGLQQHYIKKITNDAWLRVACRVAHPAPAVVPVQAVAAGAGDAAPQVPAPAPAPVADVSGLKAAIVTQLRSQAGLGARFSYACSEIWHGFSIVGGKPSYQDLVSNTNMQEKTILAVHTERRETMRKQVLGIEPVPPVVGEFGVGGADQDFDQIKTQVMQGYAQALVPPAAPVQPQAAMVQAAHNAGVGDEHADGQHELTEEEKAAIQRQLRMQEAIRDPRLTPAKADAVQRDLSPAVSMFLQPPPSEERAELDAKLQQALEREAKGADVGTGNDGDVDDDDTVRAAALQQTLAAAEQKKADNEVAGADTRPADGAGTSSAAAALEGGEELLPRRMSGELAKREESGLPPSASFVRTQAEGLSKSVADNKALVRAAGPGGVALLQAPQSTAPAVTVGDGAGSGRSFSNGGGQG